MKDKKVKDLMVPVNEYATVHKNATLVDSIIALLNAQEKSSSKHEQIRAVLVVDDDGKIIGKIGHLAFVKALEPKYFAFGNMDKLLAANLSPEFIESMMDNFKLWQDDFYDICQKANNLTAKEIMHHVEESIDEDDSLIEAIHKIIMYHSLSILVSKNGEITGILRLSDIFNELASHIKHSCKTNNG
ncbi:CBS domain-containing protein [Bacteroidetes/Chlorobi group bacterium ChocPot_Mid]|jgi:CBS domain-containing protein|nr:MAG: CBS domain-containing protein [Bacteroidetes/Chlorobi group bacterium ChocPot_Mid]